MPALLTLLRHTTEGWVISRRLCNIYRMVNVQQTNLFAQNRPNTRSLEREEERYECKESCVARYRHEHLSLNFTSQDWTIEAQRFDNYTVVIFSGTYKNRGETHLNTPVHLRDRIFWPHQKLSECRVSLKRDLDTQRSEDAAHCLRHAPHIGNIQRYLGSFRLHLWRKFFQPFASIFWLLILNG